MWAVGLAIGNTEYIYALHEGSQAQQASTGDAVTQTTSNVMGSLECSKWAAPTSCAGNTRGILNG